MSDAADTTSVEPRERCGVRLRIAYDGGKFSGYAKQIGVRTVQSELEGALSKLASEPIELRGASRTDAGVHALDQVVAFDTSRTHLPLKAWVLGTNQHLDSDVVVRTAESVGVDYNPRFDSVAKTYRYDIQLGMVRNPLLRKNAWFLGPAHSAVQSVAEGHGIATETSLDVAAMQQAAAYYVGKHDFHVFRSADDQRPNSTREIYSANVHVLEVHNSQVVRFTVRGTAFMKNMVRILTGTLVEVGQGKRTPDSIPSLYDKSAKRKDAGVTAPPHGLCLMKVELGRV